VDAMAEVVESELVLESAAIEMNDESEVSK